MPDDACVRNSEIWVIRNLDFKTAAVDFKKADVADGYFQKY